MTPPPDQVALAIDGTVALLIEYGTSAGPYVERGRLDRIPAGDMPRIVVSGDLDLTFNGISPPQFRAKLTLLIECHAEDASVAGLHAQLDLLGAQVKDALLCDAAWVRQFTALDEVRQRWIARPEGERYEGVCQIVISGHWRELYPPRVPDTLKIITVRPQPGVAGPQVPPFDIDLPAPTGPAN